MIPSKCVCLEFETVSSVVTDDLCLGDRNYRVHSRCLSVGRQGRCRSFDLVCIAITFGEFLGLVIAVEQPAEPTENHLDSRSRLCLVLSFRSGGRPVKVDGDPEELVFSTDNVLDLREKAVVENCSKKGRL